MKTEIIEGKNVKLVPFAMARENDPRELSGDKMPKGWDQVKPSIPRSGREGKRRRESRFLMRATGDDRIVGYIALEGFNWTAKSGWLGFGVGDLAEKSRDYTTEAMQLILRYAFKRLRLNRVNLNLFSWEERAIRCYEEMGFRYEGTQREAAIKGNRHWDIIDMGILRADWELLNRYPDEEPQAH